MKKLRIRHRLFVITVAIALGMILVTGLSLTRLDSAMRNGVADRTKKIVETGHSIVAYYEAEERAGRMSKEQAQAAALSALKVMRYGDNDYLFVTDHQPRMLMHPMKPEMDGTDVGGQVDIDGVYPFRAMSSTVKASGEGVVGYRWPKPGADEPQPKLSFVKGFTPWGWIVGSGVYVDDLRDAIWRETITMVGIVLAMLIGVCALTILLGRSISRPIVELTHRMRSLAEGDTKSGIPGGDRADEVGEMAQALEVFRATAIKKAEADAARAAAEREQRQVVHAVSLHLSDLSNGDLTTSITEEFPAAYATLKANFNEALAKLRALIGSVAESAATIQVGSGEIAQASEDLARRTESNAAGLEETSAAVAQMDERLRATAQAANSTLERATGTVKSVLEGREVADKAVHAMTRVADGAKGIDSVIEGLDKIAFQTRVLAMNAAVEAGRAGEAGRGFAVVADLVSALAMRSEEEAARAREELTATQADIIGAVEMVEKVDGALGCISTDVDEMHQLLGRIASDNQTQSAAIAEVSIAIRTMDQSTQQNAAMVEQTSAAARNLAFEVASLSDEAAQFNAGQVRRTTPTPATRSVGARHVPAAPVLTARHSTAMAGADSDWQAF
ncbi:methyl-accepting chemotaxis protein [Novosphingobium sp. RD2P27]|uniref:Methyl-accepting chemotaxis protein n=1 Tax=Novosphingobium kalidii TaxID=3230299 RepID=A0ABV2CX31_9SPHN